MGGLAPASVPPVTEADAPEPAFSADVDVLLNPSERAQRTAWIAHMESALGDLVVRCRRLSKFQIMVIRPSFRPMRSTPFLQTTMPSRILPYLPSIKFHNPITCLAASVRRIKPASRLMHCGLPLRKNLRSRSRNVLARRRQRRTIQRKNLKMHSSESGWVTPVILLSTTGFIRSDYDRSWKSRAQPLVSTQDC